MDNTNMAEFIYELRKAKKLTQKQLAEKLNITDKATSKWERGLGYPDIKTLPLLAEILGVTTNELLIGKREEVVIPKTDIIVKDTLEYAEKVEGSKNRKIRKIIELIITALSIVSIITCIICDLALTQSLTWSLYPLASIIFVWLIIIPLFHYKNNYIFMSLLSLSIFTIPYLFVLETIIGGIKWALPLATPIVIISLIYIWIICYMYSKTKLSIWYISSIISYLAIPVTIIINLTVSLFMNTPVYDIWDALTVILLIILGTVLIVIGKIFSKEED